MPTMEPFCATEAILVPSSLRMVPWPWLSLILAPLVALERLTKKVSFPSTLVSPLTITDIVFDMTPEAKLRVPLVPV